MRYYDPEYERIVDDKEVKRQFDFFAGQNQGFNKTFDQFVNDNFRSLKAYLVYSEMGHFVYDTDDLSDAKACVFEFGGKVEDREGNILESIGV